MKINKIEIAIVTIPRTTPPSSRGYNTMDFLITKIYTDENITGVSEIPPLPPTTRETADEIFVFLKKYLGPKVLGQDPFNIEKIWEIMNKTSHVGVCSKGAIDLALYDIMGKALNTPVYNLLGGLYAEKLPLVELVTWDPKPEEMAKKAQQFIDEGYIGLRIKVGRESIVNDHKVLKAIRDKVDWDIPIRVDPNEAWNVPKSIKNIKSLEKYDLEFVEQPIPWYDMKGMATIAKAVDVPIMAHQSMYTMQDVDNLIQLGGTDIIGVKAYRPGGGLTGTIKVLAMAEIMNIPCMMHSAIEAGICTAASVHLLAGQFNHLEYPSEVTGLHGFASDLVKNPVKIEGGHAVVPKGSGFGVELDEEAVKKYTTERFVIK